MAELPDLSDITIAAGDPVTPESVNAPSHYASVFRGQYPLEHRVDDLEHAAPLAPQACALFIWNGSDYDIAPGANNIAGIRVLGVGDVEVELSIAARTTDDWFPWVSIQRTPGDNIGEWWEYDDGVTRSALPGHAVCRIRMVEHVGLDLADAHCNFLFHAYMRNRAIGATGVGNSAPVATNDVRARICVDGVESAQHRTDLLTFCADHRERWLAGHDAEGRHMQPQAALGAFQFRRPENYSDDGELMWQAGPFESLAWGSEATASNRLGVGWRVAPGRRWRSALMSWRIASHDPPTDMALILGRPGSGAWDRDGTLRITLALPDAYWDTIVSLGVVLTGMP
jgi:hypothetical protein